MPLARFLQLSDLHLGAPWGWLSPNRREERRREQQRALETCVLQAIERGVQAILIPGDLFDREGVDAATLAFAVHVFDDPGCPPVFIAPGNHDPWSETSPCWNPRLLAARGWAWPEHVHIFGHPEWSSQSIPDSEIKIWGRCFCARISSMERPLAASLLEAVPPADPSGVQIAVFHGSLEGYCPPVQKLAAPFSVDEALSSPFAYLAVGHYHDTPRLEDRGSGIAEGVRVAYAGSLIAIQANELGRHGALEIRVEYGNDRPPVVEVETVDLDRRSVHDVTVDVSGVTSADQVDRRVTGKLEELRVADGDIVTVRLIGRLTKGVRYGGPTPELSDRFFHLRCDLRGMRPDYDLDGYRRGLSGTTEERFAQALLSRFDAETDPAERAVVESALYYGLDAFRLREVRPGYEEIGE